jgi:hypothetical protein
MEENNSVLKKEDEPKFLEFIEKQVKDHPVVKEHHAKWAELINWENGDQFSEWDAIGRKMSPVMLKVRKKKIVINLMKPLAEAIEGKINFISMYSGVPNSSDMEDIAAAKIATGLLGHNDYVNNIDNLNEEIKYDLIRAGNAWRKWTWDTGRFGYIKQEKDGKTNPVKQDGELIGTVPSVFNIRPDPTAKTRDDMRWLIELAEVTEDSILENFKITKEDLKRACGEEGDSGEKYAGMFEPENEKDKDEATHIVKYYWEKKSKKYPNGRHIITVGKLVLWQGENPAMGEIPYFHYGYKRFGNSLWHTGPLHHVQDIQREYNRMASIISEHIEGWRPKLQIPPGALVKNGAYTREGMEIIEVDTTKGDIKPVNTPELSPQVLAQRDYLGNALNTVANVHEVSYSQLPTGATRAPASLYSMMLEQENLKIDPMIKRINKTLIQEGSFRLRMMEKYYKQERLIKIMGRSNETSIAWFKGADLKGNTDVKLNIGVNIHQSKVVQQRLLLELKGQGAPIDWNKVFKLIGEGDLSEELRGDIADETRAQRENQSFLADIYDKPREDGGVFVYLHDNHELHLDQHTNLAKSEEAQRWPEKKWKALDAHIMEHYGILMQMRQAQMAMGAQPGGAAPTEQPLPGQPAGEMGGPGSPQQSPESSMQEEAISL